MPSSPSQSRFSLALLIAFGLIWAMLAIDPFNRHDWLLENLLVVGVLGALLLGARHYQPSRTAAALIFAYLCLHQLGAHFTYAKVPYDDWWQTLTGQTLSELTGWERNHYDRLVHLAYGLLLAYPMREVMLRLGLRPGFWSLILPVDVVLSTSAIYELIEWAGAQMLGGDLGRAYLGAQNDRWDAQKDMALAGAGAVVAMLATAVALYWQARRERQGSAVAAVHR